ncbi:uncharacterized protein B0H64DRAFT_361617 [Chaetomium fimeti]|uniref:Nephrocystin 3-like N-terminal domain-containing protein n=1 Tax=Chaetomium fimeti TaxID=1854472 RepID=A0AAE0HCY5_9PEZI|nr:hypothetical protein B0H64DRAFT_361617 [Chaetomium fimeti]
MEPTADSIGTPRSISNQVNGTQIIYGSQYFQGPPLVPLVTMEEQCLAFLAFGAMNDRSVEIKKPTAGTCEWLFQHRKWKRWLSDQGDLMWIKGKPGSGKSTLLRYAERERKKTGDGLILSFFFHSRGEELQRSPLGMYRSLLCQILKQEPTSLSQLVETFMYKQNEKHGSEATWRWDSDHLGNFLDWAIDDILTRRTIWLFVDALDECGREGAEEILQRFNQLRRRGLFICVSCRHYPLQNLDDGFEINAEDHNKHDIVRYTQTQLAHLESKTALSISDLIAASSNGCFSWACLAVARLRRTDIAIGSQEIGNVIRQTIDSIPQDLDDRPRVLAHNIEGTPAVLASVQWASFVQRALMLRNLLRWAVMVGSNTSQPSRVLEWY